MYAEHGKNTEKPIFNVVEGTPLLENTDIVFHGRDNRLVIEPNVKLKNSRIVFTGNNALVYLSQNTKHVYQVNIDAHHETTIYIGRDNYFNGAANIIASERQCIIIGNTCLFSFGIYVRTADPHLIYDAKTLERINQSKPVLIGDHVWLGQNSVVLKGSTIGSGSIVAAGGIVSGHTIGSNCIVGGTSKIIREGVFFTNQSVHDYSVEQTSDSMSVGQQEFCFSNCGRLISISALNRKLEQCSSSEKKLRILRKIVVNNTNTNRFYIGREEQ